MKYNDLSDEELLDLDAEGFINLDDDATLDQEIGADVLEALYPTAVEASGPDMSILDSQDGPFTYEVEMADGRTAIITRAQKEDPEAIKAALLEREGLKPMTAVKDKTYTPTVVNGMIGPHGSSDAALGPREVATVNVKETLADNPQMVLDYLERTGSVENVGRPALLQDYGKNPGYYRSLALGNEPGSLANIAATGVSALSEPGRNIAAWAAEGDADAMGKKSVEELRGYVGPTDEGLLTGMAQSVLRSPITPVALATAPLTSGPTLAATIGRGIGFGAAEGLGEVAAQSTQGQIDPTASDYATAATLGGTLAPLGDLATAGAGKMVANQTRKRLGLPPGASPLQGVKDYAKQVYRDVAPMSAVKAEAKASVQPIKKFNSAPDAARIAQAEVVGISPLDQPSSLTFGPDSPEANAERVLAQDSPAVRQKWINAWNTAKDFIRQKSDYTNAKAPMEAGNTLVEAYNRARDKMFQEANVRYSSIAENPELAAAVDTELQKNITDFYSGLADEAGEIQAKIRSSGFLPQYKKSYESAATLIEGIARNIEDVAVDQKMGTGALYQTLNDARGTLELFLQDVKKNNLEILSPQVAAIQKMKGDIRNLITAAVESHDPKLAAQLAESNNIMTNFFDGERSLQPLIGNVDKGSEAIFNGVTSNDKNFMKLGEALNMYGEGSAFKEVSDAWVANKVIQAGQKDGINLQSARTAGRKYQPLIDQIYGPGTTGEWMSAINVMDDLHNPNAANLSTKLAVKNDLSGKSIKGKLKDMATEATRGTEKEQLAAKLAVRKAEILGVKDLPAKTLPGKVVKGAKQGLKTMLKPSVNTTLPIRKQTTRQEEKKSKPLSSLR